MITQKHGRKLASQLGEVLFVCQFYDLQIVKKIYLSLRNLWLHLVQMCVCPSSPQRHYSENAYGWIFTRNMICAGLLNQGGKDACQARHE